MILLGHPALRLLLRLKLRGHLRRQARRLRTPKGLAFMVVGLIMMVGWLAMLLVAPQRGGSVLRDPLERRLVVQAVCALFTLVTVAGAFSHRGLHMPRQELEPLLSSPVSRSDLVRYRMLASVGPSMLGGLVLGAITSRNLPQPVLAFLGVYVGMLTLPLVGQGFSLLAGSAELRLHGGLTRPLLRVLQIAGLLVLALGALFLAGGADWILAALPRLDDLGSVLRQPWFALLTSPFRPYAELMTAPDLGHFLPWLGLCAVVWVAAFEGIARLPVDFRELSLSTSADVAKRLRRIQRGAGASSTEASRGTAGWRVPWLFGRGPFGAIAWRKSCSILRKARGTIMTSALILTALTLFFSLTDDIGKAPPGMFASLMIALMGTLYLCAGLRFDFREDLDLMESLKSWPLAPWRLFLATILPEVVLVVLLLSVLILGRAAVTGDFHPLILGLIALLPFVVLIWTAIDNAAFLYAPVRFVPGQEGTLHNAGRAMVMMLVRLVAFMLTLALAMLAVGAAWLLDELVGLTPAVFTATAVGLSLVALCGQVALLVWLGGVMFRRFDVARDRV